MQTENSKDFIFWLEDTKTEVVWQSQKVCIFNGLKFKKIKNIYFLGNTVLNYLCGKK